ALLVNSIIVGWVTAAMIDILKYTVLTGSAASRGEHDLALIVILFAVVGLYSTISGLWGVVVTDFVQFFLAMGGCIVFAFYAVGHVGGVDALRDRLVTGHEGGEQIFRVFPDFSAADPWMPLDIFLIMIFVQWWASWYPSSEPGGGGSVVQRMASCRDERHSVLATLWFQFAHYCIRPWPWLVVALAALAVYPDLRTLEDPGVAYPMLIRDIAPAGLRGLMLVAFLAAYMSTISTQINWAASYLVGDLYLRFLRPGADPKAIGRVSRGMSVLVILAGIVASWLMRDLAVDEAWKLLAALGAGTGAVFMLRWFWWRINAWSELSAMGASLVYFSIVSRFVASNERRLAIVAVLTIATWLVVTFLTRPEKREVLEAFYERVRPGGGGWGPIAARKPEVEADRNLGGSIIAAFLATGVVYLTLPAIGFLIFGQTVAAFACFAGAAACGILAYSLVRNLGWDRIVR
ncbi:MAG: sodium:solute symporter family transporter, partial [Vicinamibacteria bacterium]